MSSVEGQDPGPFERGLALYRDNKLDEALPLFEAAAEGSPDNAEVRAYLSETLRRLDRNSEAAEHARAALARDPCHAFSHSILGTTYAPQSSGWGDANADSSWAHLLAAVDCDPDFGDAWLGIVLEAMRRDERALEQRALRRIYESGFLTPAVLAYNRWVLGTLPDSAILLTNGDWDTYPALALQLVERLRSDVAVVNISMLPLPWYLRVIHERYGIPLLGYDPDFPVRWSSVIGSWRRLSVEEQLGRRLHAALTVGSTSSLEGASGTWQLAGPSWRFVPGEDPMSVDTAAVRAALETVEAADLAGPATSPADHSPVRISSGNNFPLAALYVANQYVHALVKSGRYSEAERVAEWADTFVVDARIPDRQSYVDGFRKTIRERLALQFPGTLAEGAVDDPPERLNCPPVAYPDSLHRAGVSGSVVARFVVGTDGAVAPGLVHVESSTHQLFTDAAVAMLSQCRFRPGRVGEKNVRTLVTMPVHFTLRP